MAVIDAGDIAALPRMARYTASEVYQWGWVFDVSAGIRLDVATEASLTHLPTRSPQLDPDLSVAIREPTPLHHDELTHVAP